VADSGGRKVLLVFTDGDDSTSAIGLVDVINLVRSSGVTIYPISFTAGAFGVGSRSFLNANAFLTQLADTSGGQVFAPKASKELASVYAKILDELTNQYVLGFVSDRPERDRRFRKLRVEVKPKALRVRHRAGYYAIPWR
jgi:Ca-activated chloride channel family protein